MNVGFELGVGVGKCMIVVITKPYSLVEFLSFVSNHYAIVCN